MIRHEGKWIVIGGPVLWSHDVIQVQMVIRQWQAVRSEVVRSWSLMSDLIEDYVSTLASVIAEYMEGVNENLPRG